MEEKAVRTQPARGRSAQAQKVPAEATLKRRLSPLNVWALALGCIIGWGAFVMPGNTFLPSAGPAGTAIAMGVAAVILIIIAFNYGYMIRRFPVAGGEFIYTQRAFGKTHGFICAWFLSLAYLAIVPLNATALALIGRNLLGGIFQVGFHYQVAGYDVYLGELILAAAALILFAFLSIRNVKTAGVFQTVLVFLLVGGVAVSCAILSGIMGFYMATSRLLLSMARENVIPAWFGRIDAKHNTPRNAILFIMCIALIAPFFGRTALGWIVDMSSIGAAIGYGYTSLAACKYALQDKRPGYVLTGILGALFGLCFAVLLLVPLPGFSCSLSVESYVCLGVWVVMGLVFFAMTAKKRAAAA